MKKFLRSLLSKAMNLLGPEPLPASLEAPKEIIESPLEKDVPTKVNIPKKAAKKPKTIPALSHQERDVRDFAEMMGIPFLALSKNRTTPILYENPERGEKVKVTAHTGHFIASIYDWDIIVFVASKMQEIINSGSDIPPRTMKITRYELLKALNRKEGKKQFIDLVGSLDRLQLTGISTTIRNQDSQYRAGFGFLDSWGYTERKDVREIHITLSQWLYDGICAQGALLKVSSKYFELTSGMKRFLYRTARKHAGKNENAWEFSVEKLYEKSGSEREFRSFKSDLKTAVLANDIPDYDIRWVERNRNSFVNFKKRKEILLLEESNQSVLWGVHHVQMSSMDKK